MVREYSHLATFDGVTKMQRGQVRREQLSIVRRVPLLCLAQLLREKSYRDGLSVHHLVKSGSNGTL